MTAQEGLLSAVLRGDAARWPAAADAGPAPAFVESVAFLDAVAWHGIQPLVARQIRRGALCDAPDGVRQPLARAAVQHAAVEARTSVEVRRVIDALARAGVPALVMKGTALAYTIYPHPCLRSRTDTDLLVRNADRAAADRVFEALGYDTLNMTRGEHLLLQRSFHRTDPLGIRHVFDVHWKIAAPPSVWGMTGWEALARAATPVPALGGHARALGDADALILSCVHRVAHHYDNPRLIWLYDIHLLAAKLGEDGVRQLLQPLEAGVAGMCVHGLLLAQERFATRLPVDVGSGLAPGSHDAVGRFDRQGMRAGHLLSDLRALPAWQPRLQLLREHLFPPADYVKRRYGVSSSLTLPALYLHRILTGALKWVRPAGGADPFA